MRTHQAIDERSLVLSRAVAAKIDADPTRAGLQLGRHEHDRRPDRVDLVRRLADPVRPEPPQEVGLAAAGGGNEQGGALTGERLHHGLRSGVPRPDAAIAAARLRARSK